MTTKLLLLCFEPTLDAWLSIGFYIPRAGNKGWKVGLYIHHS